MRVRPITMRARLLTLALLLVASAAHSQPQPPSNGRLERPNQPRSTVSIDRPTVAPAEHTSIVHRQVVRERARVLACFRRVAGVGHGRLVVRGVVREGRVQTVQVVERTGAVTEQVQDCILRMYRQMRLPADLGIETFVVPLRYSTPEPTRRAEASQPEPASQPAPPDEVEQALREQRAARRRGRCLIEAANEVRAAARAVRDRRGAARERAVRRLAAARRTLATCELATVLQQPQSAGSLTDPFRPQPPECPSCRTSDER